jgi:hypothetical protein
MSVVSAIGHEVQAGKRYGLGLGREHPDVLQDPYRCVFREVDRHHYRDYVGYALWFYEGDLFPLMQCSGPTRKVVFRGMLAAMITSRPHNRCSSFRSRALIAVWFHFSRARTSVEGKSFQ